MMENPFPTNIFFIENGIIDVEQLNKLYRTIGWDSNAQRTHDKTTQMLKVSHYYITAHSTENLLVGFARVCGDPYVAQVLDVITHPAYRCQGIATCCMQGVLAYLRRSDYISVTLTDGSRIEDFYQRFGFRAIDANTVSRVWQRKETI